MVALELAANGFLLAAVFLAAKNNWFNWVLGIIGCALFAVLFFSSKLYADVTLQLFFIITNFIGLWNWRRGDDEHEEKPITQTRPIWRLLTYFPLAALSAYAYGWLLTNNTDAHYPLIDSSILTFSIVAQFLLMARKIETWVFWLIVNTIAVPLFFAKALYVTSFVYGLFWINALYGYWNWRKELRQTA